MRTLHRAHPATLRSFFLLLIGSLCVFLFARLANSEMNPDLPAPSESPFYSAFGAAQEGATVHTGSIGVAQQRDVYSVTPETLGDLMMIHQRYLAAIAAYQRAPHDSAIVWNKLGIAYQHMYALDLAKLQYEKALTLDPHYAEAINNLGTIFYGQQNYRKAEKYYRSAIKLKPNSASFYSNLGTAYFADRDYKHGLEAYRKAFSLNPEVFMSDPLDRVAEVGPPDEQVALNYALARLYAQAGMVEPAIHYLRIAFMDGFTDNKKLMQDTAFARIRTTTQFRLLLTEEHVKEGNTEQSLVVRDKATMQ
ncbi:MAG TPA: tetratricopeptide repeat protein [Acidobacteriaceae bacterium]|nr:tetratricopeptide repeat protein [Acidobacteriaceae bacterium]